MTKKPFAMSPARLEARRKGGRAKKAARAAGVAAKHFDLIVEATVALWPRHQRARTLGTAKRDHLIYAELAEQTGLSVRTIKRAMRWIMVKQ